MNKSRTLFRLAMLLLPLEMMFSLVGCRMDDLAADMLAKSNRLTIRATYENMNGDTKTVLHDDGHVYWSPHDSISVFYGSGDKGGSKFIAQATSEVRITNFEGEIGVITGGDEISEDETFFWGLYPYDAESVCDGQTITAKISDRQIGVPNTFSPGTAPSLGHDQGLMLAFRNIYSGLIFSVEKPGFLSLTISTNNGALIAGRAKVGIGSGNNPEVREIIEGTSSVTVLAPTSEGFEVGKKYYMIFFPFSGSFTLKLNSATQTGSFTGSMSFQRNKLNEALKLDRYCQFEDLVVTRANFPDEHFANYVFSSSGLDQDGDGVLSEAELNDVERISLCTDTVASVKGIELFPNLKSLSISGTRTKDSNLGYYVVNGRLTELDVSKNNKLEELHCYYNGITELDVSHNPELSALNCYYNDLSSLDVSINSKLIHLNCQANELTSINVSRSTDLKRLICNHNKMTVLDVSHNPSLERLTCYNNFFTSLDIRGNQQLTNFDCNPNSKLQIVYMLNEAQRTRISEGFLDIPEGVSIVYDNSSVLYEIPNPDESNPFSMLTDGSDVLLISQNGTFGASSDTMIVVSLLTKDKTLIITDDKGYPSFVFGEESLFAFDINEDDGSVGLLKYDNGSITCLGQIESNASLNSKTSSLTKSKINIIGFRRTLEVLRKVSDKNFDAVNSVLDKSMDLLSMIDNIYNNPNFRYVQIGTDIYFASVSLFKVIGGAIGTVATDGVALPVFIDGCIEFSQSINDLLEDLYPPVERREAFKQYYINEYGISLTPLDATNIGATSATLNGTIQMSKPLNYKAHFRVFSPAYNDRYVPVESGSNIHASIIGLAPYTLYWYWLEIEFSKGGLDYSVTSDDSVEFATLDNAIETGDYKNIGESKCVIFFNVNIEDSLFPAEAGICISSSNSNPTLHDGYQSFNVSKNGKYALTFDLPKGDYYYRAFLRAGEDILYGRILSLSPSEEDYCPIVIDNVDISFEDDNPNFFTYTMRVDAHPIDSLMYDWSLFLFSEQNYYEGTISIDVEDHGTNKTFVFKSGSQYLFKYSFIDSTNYIARKKVYIGCSYRFANYNDFSQRTLYNIKDVTVEYSEKPCMKFLEASINGDQHSQSINYTFVVEKGFAWFNLPSSNSYNEAIINQESNGKAYWGGGVFSDEYDSYYKGSFKDSVIPMTKRTCIYFQSKLLTGMPIVSSNSLIIIRETTNTGLIGRLESVTIQ